MSYFKYLPKTSYTLDGHTYVVQDILSRVKFKTEVSEYFELYEEYEWKDSDSIESVAKEYYGSANYYWIILLFNEIHDIHYELPLSAPDLQLYIESKYGENSTKIRHWLDLQTNTIAGEFKEYYSSYVEPANPGEPGNIRYVPVTFAEYENDLNEKKRSIKLLRAELLTEFISQFKAAFE